MVRRSGAVGLNHKGDIMETFVLNPGAVFVFDWSGESTDESSVAQATVRRTVTLVDDENSQTTAAFVVTTEPPVGTPWGNKESFLVVTLDDGLENGLFRVHPAFPKSEGLDLTKEATYHVSQFWTGLRGTGRVIESESALRSAGS